MMNPEIVMTDNANLRQTQHNGNFLRLLNVPIKNRDQNGSATYRPAPWRPYRARGGSPLPTALGFAERPMIIASAGDVQNSDYLHPPRLAPVTPLIVQ